MGTIIIIYHFPRFAFERSRRSTETRISVLRPPSNEEVRTEISSSVEAKPKGKVKGNCVAYMREKTSSESCINITAKFSN